MKRVLFLFILILAIPFVIAEDCDTFCTDKNYVSGTCRFNRGEYASCDKGEIEFGSDTCDADNQTTVCCCLRETPEPEVTCDGCEIDGQCLAVGEINGSKYCSADKGLVDQKAEAETCANDYECASNTCLNETCAAPCDGCRVDSQCLQTGEVKDQKYCSTSTNMVDRKQLGVICDADYECLSDLCKGDKCREPCEGCEKDDVCHGPGKIIGTEYCGVDNSFHTVKEKGQECSNDYECQDNICYEGKCGKPSIFVRFWSFIVNLFK